MSIINDTASISRRLRELEGHPVQQLTLAPLDPNTPECSICGARIYDPCRTLERAKYCELPSGVTYTSGDRGGE